MAEFDVANVNGKFALTDNNAFADETSSAVSNQRPLSSFRRIFAVLLLAM